MKNLKWGQLNLLLGIFCGIILAIVLIAGVFIHKPTATKATADGVTSMSQSWILTEEEQDTGIDLPIRLEANAGQLITISHYLPDSVDTDYVLSFRSMYQAVEVQIDGEVIYQYGIGERRPFVKSPVPAWNFVPIKQEDAGKRITLTFVSNYGRYAGVLPEIYCGNRGAITQMLWKQNGWSFFFAAILIVGSIVALAVLFGFRLQNKADCRIRYYAIYAILVSAWSLTGNVLSQTITSNVYAVWLLHNMLLLVLPVAYLIFLRGFIERKKVLHYMDYAIGITGVAFIAFTTFQLIGIWEFAYSYATIITLIGIGMLAITVIVGIAVWAYHIYIWMYIFWANISFCLFWILQRFVPNSPNLMYQLTGDITQIGIIIYMCLLGTSVGHVIILQLNHQEKIAEESMIAQRKNLVARMNPNFIFTAFAYLLDLIKQGSNKSARYVFDFSNYIRYNFDAIREDAMVTFDTELEHINSYLAIQQIRIPNLNISIKNKKSDFLIPAATVEVIVENAVKHGIEKKDGSGKIVIRSYERRDCYAIQVIDNGIGMKNTERLFSKTSPNGMRMVRNRFAQIGATIEVNSKLDKGTIVTIKIPRNWKDETDGDEE